MVKLSIVIAYYKCYEYTKKLLDILVPQLTDEAEVILVDDGCNETRLDKYKDKIDIIHLPKNSGGGCACNVGIDYAKGQYIGFIDADDYVSEDYIETLINAINNNPTDVIYMDWQDTFTKDIITRPDNYAPWKAIYNRNIIPRFCAENRFHFDVAFYDELKRKGFTRSDTDRLLYFYNSKREGNLSEIDNKLKEEGKYDENV